MHLIDVWDCETLDDGLTAVLDENAELIRDYHVESRLIWLEREMSDHRGALITNPNADQFIHLTERVGNAMPSRCIRAWHYTRQTDAEVAAFRASGIVPSTIEGLRSRLAQQVAGGALTESEAEAVFAASPFHSDQHDARANKFWMTSHPLPPDNGGVELLLGNWGGEVAYFWLRDNTLVERLSRLGRGRVYEIAVPLITTRDGYSAAQAVIASYARKLGCFADEKAFDLYVEGPLGPEHVIAVHSEGEPAFAKLARGYPEGFVDTREVRAKEYLADLGLGDEPRSGIEDD